eukprot:3913162-Rhodomonas_salina.1
MLDKKAPSRVDSKRNLERWGVTWELSAPPRSPILLIGQSTRPAASLYAVAVEGHMVRTRQCLRKDALFQADDSCGV